MITSLQEGKRLNMKEGFIKYRIVKKILKDTQSLINRIKQRRTLDIGEYYGIRFRMIDDWVCENEKTSKNIVKSYKKHFKNNEYNIVFNYDGIPRSVAVISMEIIEKYLDMYHIPEEVDDYDTEEAEEKEESEEEESD